MPYLNIDKYDAMAQQLQSIVDIGFDYNGYHSTAELKKLIDKLVGMASQGLDGIRPYYITFDKRGNKTFVESVMLENGNYIQRELSEETIVAYTKNVLK